MREKYAHFWAQSVVKKEKGPLKEAEAEIRSS